LETLYGSAQALFGIDLGVGVGEVVAVLGRNGAGKSTLLKSIIGLVRPAAGSIVFAGAEIAGLPAYRISRRGIGYVPEERRIFTGLSVSDNLEVGRRRPCQGVPAWDPERIYALFPVLADMRRRAGREISGGEQQMLAIARTLMGNPRLILLDEPSQGLAPRVACALAGALAGLKAEGLTVLLSEQNVRFAAGLADRAVVIETGQVRWTGSMAKFVADTAAQHDLLHV
jgi:branched-chain amino acid transport system ATP-binding protein